jgi:hypothetical protein
MYLVQRVPGHVRNETPRTEARVVFGQTVLEVSTRLCWLR